MHDRDDRLTTVRSHDEENYMYIGGGVVAVLIIIILLIWLL